MVVNGTLSDFGLENDFCNPTWNEMVMDGYD